MKTKSQKQFTKLKTSNDGLQPWCTVCRNNYKLNHRRSYLGLPSEIYLHQKFASKKRGHNPPNYTRKELKQWMITNPSYKLLHDEWVASGYKKEYAPSIDRIHITRGYTIDNIQLMTWEENRKKGHLERKTDNRICYRVKQIDMQGNTISTFPSMRQAARDTNIDRDTIRGCIAGEYKQAGGYLWERI